MSIHRRVYVGNIPYSCSKLELTRHMSAVGEISRINILTNEIGQPRGKAIIEYVSEEAAQRAVLELNKTTVDGRAIIVKENENYQVQVKKPPSPRYAANAGQIYFTNLPLSVTWQQLKDVCTQVGPVQRAEVPLTTTGVSKGMGLVYFEKYTDALEAVKLLNGAVFNDRRVQVFLDSKTFTQA